VLSAIEAERLGMGKPDARGRATTGPVAWFLGVCLLWIPCYPAYLFCRRSFRVRSLGWAGIFSALLYTGVASMMSAAIEERWNQVRRAAGLPQVNQARVLPEVPSSLPEAQAQLTPEPTPESPVYSAPYPDLRSRATRSGAPGVTAAPRPPVCRLTFETFDECFGADSAYSELQKKQMFPMVQGKRVRWTGQVVSVDEETALFGEEKILVMTVKHKPSTWTSDVSVKFALWKRAALLSIYPGQWVTYEGTIGDFGELLNHRLSDGEIVSVQ